MNNGMPRLPRAACRTPEGAELFANPEGHNTAACKAICMGCNEWADCLRWALKHESTWGVWAGMTGPELDRVRLEHGIQLEQIRAGVYAYPTTQATTRSTP